MLKDLNIKNVYDSSTDDLVADIIVPLLSNSVEYLRGVGYFTSGWLKNAAVGISDLISNGGLAKFIISPIISKDDWEYFIKGNLAKNDPILKKTLKVNLEDIEENLNSDTLNTMAWLIADDLMQIKFAIPKTRTGGDYHDKVAVFKDSLNDYVAFHGSFNDTYKGSLNGEALSVFKSWDQGQLPYVKTHYKRLLNLWNNANEQFNVLELPDSIKKDIIKLRTLDRPYKIPAHKKEESSNRIILRDYQEIAIKKWYENDRKGILEMATGTGKTITSISAAKRVLTEEKKQALIVLVPYIHLADQWKKDLEKFEYDPIICSSSHANWKRKIKDKILAYNLGVEKSLCILSTHQTASMVEFLSYIDKIQINIMVIGDEIHHLGSNKLKNGLIEKYKYRLGLSATPSRWFDEKGSSILQNYFNGTCFCFPLKDAIGKHLVNYHYYPLISRLNEEETLKYDELTEKINKLSVSKSKNNEDLEDRLLNLNIKRTAILSNAESKLPKLLEILNQLKQQNEKQSKELKNVLIYCAPGGHKKVLKAVSELGLRCHEFVHSVTAKKRQEVISEFIEGNIQVLVAIKCLDEGVDIPSIKTAFILASTTNPMEFIQRRGRILRKSPNKNEAEIYDFVAMPAEGYIDEKHKSILRREMPRVVEFSSLAINQYSSKQEISSILFENEMMELENKTSWDIYIETTKEV